MTGRCITRRVRVRAPLALLAAISIAACDENGEFAFPGGGDTAAKSTDAQALATPLRNTEEDVERPDIFDVTDRGLWDGRPSLGGIWVAHPDVTDPERAVIRNPANGRSVIGALFRRERENPGPPLQVSSDAAEQLGILPGAPTEITVIALRRVEVEVAAEEPSENPVIADLAAPVTVEATPLEPLDDAAAAVPVAGAAAAAAIDTTDAATSVVEVTLPPAPPVPPQIVEAEELTGNYVQIGVFTVEPNANAAAQRLRDAGVPTSVLAQESGGRTVWRVVSGPSDDEAARDASLTQIKELGFVDAFAVGSDG